MGHGVDHVIDADLHRHRGVFLGILGQIGPFPGVSQILIEADRHYHAAAIVQDAAPVRVSSPALDLTAVNHIQTGNTEAFAEVVDRMEDRIVVFQLDKGMAREYLLDTSPELPPFALIVEVVHHEEAAALEILLQPRGLGCVENPVAHSNGIDPGPIEDFVVVDVDDLFHRTGVDTRKAPQLRYELPVGFVGVSTPPGAPVAAKPVAVGTEA